MEKVELENKIEKAPKTVKKSKDEFTQDTYDFFASGISRFCNRRKV